MEGNGGKKAEAERWLEISGKLLMARDLVGSKKFAVRAQESDPLLDGVDQILAVADVLLAAEKRINNHMDWYAILQIDHRSNNSSSADYHDLELIKRQYRKLALLLHPDKNKSVYADNAFKLVSDAWTVLSDPSKKSLYDNELNLFMKFDPVALHNPHHHHQQQQQQNPTQNQEGSVRRSTREKRKTGKGTTVEEPISQPRNENRNETRPPPPAAAAATAAAPVRSATRSATKMSSFWTSCPYCYNLYEYPRVYEECCLRCQNCRRAFHAAVIPSPPPVVPGQEAYYCCWAFFPLGFQVPSLAGGKIDGLPNWTPFSTMHPVSSQPSQLQNNNDNNNQSKFDSDKDGDDGDDGEMDGASDGSWDQGETGSRKKGKFSAEVRKGPVIKKTARKSVPPRSTRGNVIESLQDGHVTRGFEGNNNIVLPSKLTPQKNMKKQVVGRKPTRRAGKFASESEIVDLNEDLKIEFDDPNSTVGVEVASGDEDPVAGIGFFEGLDDILGNLGNLPILSVPADQNKTAQADA